MFAKKTQAALILAASAALLGGCATYGMDDGAMASADSTVMVGGAAMYPTRNIIENAVNSKDHTTLVAAVKAAGLVDTLSGPGPFTVFAPTNAAFAKLPAGTVDTLLKPENKATLTKILTYHVVPGRVSAEDLMMKIKQGGGMAKLTTVEGGTLTAKMMGGNVVLVDEKGGMATVTQADVFQSNGVIHVTDTVSMPG
ncbi:fasciclin domain-containing protein [Citromicrobium bathyomarinum]|uniref:fasciclin domain-containing protein n=1 Tax=Citromicrobium bathyomarinum TaxID=72174 RepID=UPI003CC91ADE